MGQQKDIDCKIERITNGPKHHLFGFHDLLITNNKGDKYLSLEVDTINRPPLPGELFGVGYVKDGCFVKVGETIALNYPQGARQQWLAGGNCFTVNNRVGDVWGTDLYDASTNQLLDRFKATTHMLTKDGRFSFGLDYARLYRLGGYGYSGIEDRGMNDVAPFDSGITIMDMQTKEIKVLVSVREVAEFGNNGRIPGVSHHYLTHLCVNPSSTRIAFLHRYFMADGGFMNRLMTIGIDGSGLRCLAQGFLSHFDWKDDNHIYIYGRVGSGMDNLRNNRLLSNPIMSFALKNAKKAVRMVVGKNKSLGAPMSFLMITDEEHPVVAPFAQGIILKDGHPMTNPKDSDWCINDTYPEADKCRTLMLYHFPDNLRVNLGRFCMLDEHPDMKLKDIYFKGVDPKIMSTISEEQLAFTRSGLHCDLHPRWTADGKVAVFDSIHEGTRQIYAVNVEDIIKLK